MRVAGTAEPLILVGDIGGSKISLATGGESIDCVDYSRTPRDIQSAFDTIAVRSAVILDGRVPDVVSFSIAGEVSKDGETITRGGPLQEYGWVGERIREGIAEAARAKPDMAFMANDTESAALAEREIDRRRGRLVPGYKGLIETISSGNGGAVYDEDGATNIEPGHLDSGQEAPVVCGCGGRTCLEAHISGNSVGAAWGTRLEHVPHNDPRWAAYHELFARMQIIKLDKLRGLRHNPQKWSFFGSVALLGPEVVENFASRLAEVEPAIYVTRAHYGNQSGLYGAYFAAKERLAA